MTGVQTCALPISSYIGKRASEDEIAEFIEGAEAYSGQIKIPGIKKPLKTNKTLISDIAEKYLFAAKKAGEIFRKIEKSKGKGNFITEVSMDEVPLPQTPVELFFILKMLGEEKIPVQTIAPKFSGRFNKGVDYVGDPLKFAIEFEADLMVIDFAIKEFGLPENLKMSIHSGSDKFAIYPYIGSLIRLHDKGVHVKTAGTTWLEEVIGLGESGGEALDFVKEIYAESLEKIEELCGPYSDVIDINATELPSADEVSGWNSFKFASTLRHEQGNPDYNPNIRQLIHVAYKLAAMKMDKYSSLLQTHEAVVSGCVYDNIYNRHICRLFDIK